MAIPVRTKSGKSLGGKFAYRDEKGAIKTHNSFRKMWDAQEKRRENAILNWKRNEKYIEGVTQAHERGEASEKQISEALARAKSSRAKLEHAIGHEPFFMEFMGDMTEKQRGLASIRIHDLKGRHSTASRYAELMEFLLESRRAQRKPAKPSV